MTRRPSALFLLTLAALLVLATLLIEPRSAGGAIVFGSLATLLLGFGLARIYRGERELRELGAIATELVASLEKNLADGEPAADKLRLLDELARFSGPQERQALVDAYRALFRRLEEALGALMKMTAEWEKSFDAVEDGIVILDDQRRILRLNRAAGQMLALNRDEVVGLFCCGRIHREGCSPEHCSALMAQQAGGGVRGELSTQGDQDILEVFTSPLVDAGGQVFGSVHLLRDIGKELRSAHQHREIQQSDPLTGLPVRSRFRAELQRAVEAAYRDRGKVAVLLVDLDGFSDVNAALGHNAGDQLLSLAALRLRESLAPEVFLSRLGGDEFALFLTNGTAAAAAGEEAEQILSRFGRPFQLSDSQPLYCTASIGISVFPDDAHDVSQLLKHADIAMCHAKQQGRNTARTFSSRMDTDSLERLRLGTNLRHALERDEFELHYQPRIDLTTRQVCGMEALLRWTNLELGEVPPGRFIPLAEENGLILPIGEWVLREACRQVQSWRSRGLQPPKVAVNLSALQLRAENIVPTIAAALDASGLDADLLELELTETVLMADFDASIAKLKALREMGVKIALDDFGTGYSSLSYLKNVPIDHLKIDRSFVRDICENADGASIVEVIISIAHSLGLKVVAEGVETPEQLAFLTEHQCDEVQGFFFSPPRPATAAPDFFSSVN